MKKILALILALTMLVATFAACGSSSSDGEVTEGEKEVTRDPKLPAIPDDLDISGDFNILVSGNMERNDFEASEDAGTTVEVAIFRRNEAIRQAYGVNVTNEDITKFGSSSGSGAGFQKIYNEYMAGTSNYDAAMIGTSDVATLAYNGLLWDLASLKYIDLTKDYWDQKANEDLAIAGRMFYTTGDISIVDNIYTHALIFNKTLISDYGLDNPYDLVNNNEWTLEKFGSLVKQIGEDVDQNGIYNEKDRYGLLTWNDPMAAVLASSGEKIASVNESGTIELTFYNERVVNLYDRFCDIVFDQAHAYNYQYDNQTGKGTATSSWDTNRDAIFNENRAAFYFSALSVVERHRDSEVDFGILPYPKLDSTQEDFGHSVSGFHSSFLCVPLMAQNPTRSSAVLELLAYYGKEYLTPAYYEKTLYGQYVRDEESTDMLDIIFATHVYDIGQYYAIGTYSSQLTSLFTTRNSISSIYETYRTSAESKIEALNESFSKLSY